MAERPVGFGMTKELKAKTTAKWNPKVCHNVIRWMEAVTGESLYANVNSCDAVHAILKDGVYICKVANRLGANVKINETKSAFKMMENIGYFLQFGESLGVKRLDLFQTVDLFEGQNMHQVMIGLSAVVRQACKCNSSLPPFCAR